MKFFQSATTSFPAQSPPSRGAWIEIGINNVYKLASLTSPPSRGAWIEMYRLASALMLSDCRPPRGGRGLKSAVRRRFYRCHDVAPLAGGVD